MIAIHLEVILGTWRESTDPKVEEENGVLKFLRKWMTIKQRKKLAEGLIMSQILCGINVWEKLVPKTTIEKVQIVQP